MDRNGSSSTVRIWYLTNMYFYKHLLIALFLSATLCGQAQETGSVQVATMAPNNRKVTVYYRVPKDYDAKRLDSYRVLFIFGGRNTTGKADVTGLLCGFASDGS